MTARRTNVSTPEDKKSRGALRCIFLSRYTPGHDWGSWIFEAERQPVRVAKMDYLFISNAFPGDVFSPPSSKPRRRQTPAYSEMSPAPHPSLTLERSSVLSPENGGIKRTRGSREDNFTIKHGSRHHSYDPEKAPYPLSYDKDFIGM